MKFPSGPTAADVTAVSTPERAVTASPLAMPSPRRVGGDGANRRTTVNEKMTTEEDVQRLLKIAEELEEMAHGYMEKGEQLYREAALNRAAAARIATILSM
jgi:hypothetical protein